MMQEFQELDEAYAHARDLCKKMAEALAYWSHINDADKIAARADAVVYVSPYPIDECDLLVEQARRLT